MSQPLDTQGEAHDALGAAVNSYGQRVLNDAPILGNLVTDLLPDLPRERNLLVTGAEAGVAADITQHVEEQHIDPDTAVQLVARTLSERRSIDPAASMWVTTEYAQALGYRVRPYAEAAQAQQSATPAMQPTMTSLGGQPTPTLAQEPGTQQPQWQAAQAPQGGPGPYVPPQGPPSQGPQPWQAWPNAQQGPSWPPTQPATGRPPSARSGRKLGIIIGGIVAGLAAVFLVVAAVAGIAPFSKSSSTGTASSTGSAKPTQTPVASRPARPATPTQSPTPTLAAGVTPLVNLLPQDIADPTTQCSAVKKPSWSSPGLVSGLSCDDPNLPKGGVSAYQLDNRADYNTTWQNFNTWSSFDESTAGSNCPPSGSGAQGLTPWNSQGGFPSMQGQVLECWTGSNAAPIYVWTLPSQDAFIIAVGADGSSFKALDNWWKSSNSSPANAPASPHPTSS
jgi:hypothetical protein